MLKVALRRETKNKWERRTALTPEGVKELAASGIPVAVERSPIRVYPNEDYENIGAKLVDSTNTSELVLGIKEPPLDTVCNGQIHLCFSHTIKGQPYNMPLLRAFLERGGTLIDYEPMSDDQGKRIAAVFSRYAGFSGTIETFVTAAKKLEQKGLKTPLSKLEQPWKYGRMDKAKQALRALAPLNEELRILIVGAGNVGQGCVAVCKELGIPELPASRLDQPNVPAGPWYVLVDAAEIVRARDGRPFDFPTYTEMGKELFESTFERFLGSVDMVLQGMYWDERFPRQLPRELIAKRSTDLPWIIGDISCDIDGTLACTTQSTSIDEPDFTFNTKKMQAEPGVTWNGPTVMAIDNLPCELPADASDEFSRLLVPCVKALMQSDLSKPFEKAGLSNELQRGTIVYRGELTPRFKYLSQYL